MIIKMGNPRQNGDNRHNIYRVVVVVFFISEASGMGFVLSFVSKMHICVRGLSCLSDMAPRSKDV
jgi:hypothetical protein